MKEIRFLLTLFLFLVLVLAIKNKHDQAAQPIEPQDLGFKETEIVSFNYTDSFGSYHCIALYQKGFVGGVWCERLNTTQEVNQP